MNKKFFLSIALVALVGTTLFAQESAPQYQTSSRLENQIKFFGAYNVLSSDYPQAGLGASFNMDFTRFWGFGLQAGFNRGFQSKDKMKLSSDYKAFRLQWNADLLARFYPINLPHHKLAIGAGYSFCSFTSNSLLADDSEYLFRRNADHGIVAQLSYDYIFKNGLSLGVQCQYNKYFVHSSTPAPLQIGITIGYNF